MAHTPSLWLSAFFLSFQNKNNFKNNKMKKIIGYSILVAFFSSIFLFITLVESILAALFVFGLMTLVVGLIFLAIYLIEDS